MAAQQTQSCSTGRRRLDKKYKTMIAWSIEYVYGVSVNILYGNTDVLVKP